MRCPCPIWVSVFFPEAVVLSCLLCTNELQKENKASLLSVAKTELKYLCEDSKNYSIMSVGSFGVHFRNFESNKTNKQKNQKLFLRYQNKPLRLVLFVNKTLLENNNFVHAYTISGCLCTKIAQFYSCSEDVMACKHNTCAKCPFNHLCPRNTKFTVPFLEEK